MLYNIALLSAIHQHESATHVHTSPPSWSPLPSPMASHLSWLSKSTGLSSLCHTASCHLSDILVCKVKWALGSITTNKASGGVRIAAELFQFLKDDAVKVLHSICQQIWKIQQWPQELKRSVFIPIPKEGNVKDCSNYCTIALISHATKVMLKILQARLQN